MSREHIDPEATKWSIGDRLQALRHNSNRHSKGDILQVIKILFDDDSDHGHRHIGYALHNTSTDKKLHYNPMYANSDKNFLFLGNAPVFDPFK